MERIYIGGLDPPRLTAEEVASRLESISGITIRSKDLVPGKSFFYVNAIKNDDAEGSSALGIVAKQYNNVTWKRCKLVVQAARPHFLERLEQERLERQQRQQHHDVVPPEEEETEAVSSRKIPRHLRIRQRYGEEAHHVDTKPCPATDWSDFSHTMRKMRTRRENHRIKVLAARKAPPEEKVTLAKQKKFLNRAIHLRLKEMEKESGMSPSIVNVSSDGSFDQGCASASGSSGMSDSDESDSEETAESEPTPFEKGRSSTYVWSEEESDDSSVEASAEVAIENDVDDNALAHQQVVDVPSEEMGGVPSESGEIGEDNSLSSSENVVKTAAQYEWSSDDDDADADDANPLRSASSILDASPTKAYAEEFSAAINFGDTLDDDQENSEDNGERNDISAGPIDLNDDVKANLGVLSTLFPDMANATPRLAKSEHGGERVDASNGEGGGKRPKTIQPGWEMGPSSYDNIPSISDGLGLMQRFDPSKESAKKYIIEPSAPDVENEKIDEVSDEPEQKEIGASEDGTSDEEEPTASADETKEEKVDDTKTTVYEQAKLENIFRQARASESSKNINLSAESQQAENGGSFAFGFDVGVEPYSRKEATKPSDVFTFSFDLSAKASQATVPKAETTVGEISVNDDAKISVQTKEAAEDNTASKVSAGIRRRGMTFPEHVLNEYTDAFFAMNDGARILEDPEGFLYDDDVKREWMKARSTLTLDWKRKRKYAQSRMQKKMKFR